MNWGRIIGLGAKKAARLAADDSMRKQFARLEVENDTLRAERDYWKARAETLIDAALAKAGHSPVMAPTQQSHLTDLPYAGLRVTSIKPAPTAPQEATR